MRTWPKPVQRPHPPVIVGGAFPESARPAIRYGDGWVPNASRTNYADGSEFLPQFKQMAEAVGRSPATLPITIFGAPENLGYSSIFIRNYTGCSGFVGIRPGDPPGTRPLGGIDPSNCPLIAKNRGTLREADAIDSAIRSFRNEDARSP